MITLLPFLKFFHVQKKDNKKLPKLSDYWNLQNYQKPPKLSNKLVQQGYRQKDENTNIDYVPT